MALSKRRMKVLGSSTPIMIKVRFLVDCGDGEFKEGDVTTLKAASANHWIKRGMAEKYKQKAPARKKPGRQAGKKKEEPKEEKSEDSLELPKKEPPITVTDPTPELEKDPSLEAEKK